MSGDVLTSHYGVLTSRKTSSKVNFGKWKNILTSRWSDEEENWNSKVKLDEDHEDEEGSVVPLVDFPRFFRFPEFLDLHFFDVKKFKSKLWNSKCCQLSSLFAKHETSADNEDQTNLTFKNWLVQCGLRGHNSWPSIMITEPKPRITSPGGKEKKSKEIVNQFPLLYFDFRLHSKAFGFFETWPMKSLKRRFNETSDAN